MNFADRDQVSFKASKHPSFALGLNFEAISTLQRSHRIQNFRCLLYLRQSLCPSCLKGRMSMLSYAIMLNACSSNLASKHGLLDLRLVKLLKLVHNLLSLLLRLHQSM